MFDEIDKTAHGLYGATGSLLNGVWDHTAQTWSDSLHGKATLGQYAEFGAEAIGVTALVAFGGYRGVSKLMSLTERNAAPLGKAAMSMETVAGMGEAAAARTASASRLAGEGMVLGEQTTARLGGVGGLVERVQPGLLSGSSVEATALSRSATGLDNLTLRSQSLMMHGAEFKVLNPKTGGTLDTTVSIIKNEAGQAESHLFTAAGEKVAMVRALPVEPPPGAVSHTYLYGHPRTQNSFLYLDMMRIEPKFQGQGVREALVQGLRDQSLELGLGGRIKLQAATDFGSVSAIPWYKAGFRPQVGGLFHAEKFEEVAASLETAVKNNIRVPLEEGQKFNNLLMYLPVGG